MTPTANASASTPDRTSGSALPRVAIGLCFVVLIGALFAWIGKRGRNSEITERTGDQLIQREGKLYNKADKQPFTGWLVERTGDASLKSKSWLSNGILNGISEGWYTNGVMQVREHFVGGLANGPVTRWNEDGSKRSEGTAREGKLEGSFRRWHPSGQLAEEVTFHAGTPDGVSHAWHPDGSLKAEVRHEHGTIVDRHYWKPGEKDGRALAVQGVPSR